MKWHQAFRVFSDILNSKHPHKATELIQYEHVIHTASQTYMWDNVYTYDKDFGIHISQFPDRTWAVILQQAYALRLKDKFRSNEGSYGNKNNNNPKKEVCRLFQQGKCNYGVTCKYQHRCDICNKFGHGAHICRKRSGDYREPANSGGRDRDNRDRYNRDRYYDAPRSDCYHYYKSDQSDKRDDDKNDKRKK